MRGVDEQTILVTGATDGLGRALAGRLAAHGATVLLHGRSEPRLRDALLDIEEATGNDRLRAYRADFSSLAEVRRLGQEVASEEERLDVLINNAGIGGGPRGGRREESVDGHELRFGVNYLAPFLLTHLLAPLLRRSVPARIVNVSSAGQAAIDFDDLMLERRYDGFRAYAQSKLAQIMWTIDVAPSLTERGVTINALHPATLMDTTMVRQSFGRSHSTVEEGARATGRLVTDPAVDGVTGRYFDGMCEATVHPQAYDADARRRLRELTRSLLDG